MKFLALLLASLLGCSHGMDITAQERTDVEQKLTAAIHGLTAVEAGVPWTDAQVNLLQAAVEAALTAAPQQAAPQTATAASASAADPQHGAWGEWPQQQAWTSPQQQAWTSPQQQAWTWEQQAWSVHPVPQQQATAASASAADPQHNAWDEWPQQAPQSASAAATSQAADVQAAPQPATAASASAADLQHSAWAQWPQQQGSSASSSSMPASDTIRWTTIRKNGKMRICNKKVRPDGHPLVIKHKEETRIANAKAKGKNKGRGKGRGKEQ
jgi:hypothetical protein